MLAPKPRERSQCGDTRTALVTVEAQDARGPESVRSALAELSELLETYAGGQTQAAIVDVTAIFVVITYSMYSTYQA